MSTHARNHSIYRKLIDRFPRTRVLVVGDVMVDRFIRGKVTRISPEAPVPVVQVRDEADVPGGAGNVIMNLAALGAQVACCGLVGDDAAGRSLRARFREIRVDTEGLKTDALRRTTLKTRVLAEHQQVVRFDHENTSPLSSTTQAELMDYLSRAIPETDGVILSDYGKGVITQSLASRAIAIANKYKKPICVDPKIEHFQSYKKVTCITPNLAEALGGMRRTGVSGVDGIVQLGRDILKKLGSESVLITRGEDGMSLFEKNRVTHIPTRAQEVFDVTGAGDTVISVLALCLAGGSGLVRGSTLANLAAGIVVGKLGTATVSPAELKKSLVRL